MTTISNLQQLLLITTLAILDRFLAVWWLGHGYFCNVGPKIRFAGIRELVLNLSL